MAKNSKLHERAAVGRSLFAAETERRPEQQVALLVANLLAIGGTSVAAAPW